MITGVTARLTRKYEEWACPRCNRRFDRKQRCPTCGIQAAKQTVREERSISWTGDIRPSEIRAALGDPSLAPSEMRRLERRSQPVSATSQEEDRVTDQVADVLIMTALGKEQAAVLNSAPGNWEDMWDLQGVHYHLTSLPNGVRVALTGTTNVGPVSAALATTHAITALRPSRVVFTGIAAGIGDDVELGDIVLSDQIVDYDIGKVKLGAYTPRWRAYPADPTIVRAARNESSAMAPIAGALQDRPDHSVGLPKVHVGTVLAGSKVVADVAMVDSLRTAWAQAIGLEMEGGGGAAAAHEHPVRPTFVIIKGVCDRADSAKNDDWQEYAARAAALYTLGLLAALGGQFVKDVKARPEPVVVVDEVEPKTPTDQFSELGVSPTEVQTMLKSGFDKGGLYALCVNLDIDWDDLRMRETKTEAIASIVDYCKLRRLVKALMSEMKKMNPGLFE